MPLDTGAPIQGHLGHYQGPILTYTLCMVIATFLLLWLRSGPTIALYGRTSYRRHLVNQTATNGAAQSHCMRRDSWFSPKSLKRKMTKYL